MKNIYLKFFPLILITASFSRPACAGPLRLVASGGPQSAFGPLTFSESDIDFQRPADLVNIQRGSISFSKDIESDFDQTKGDKTLNLADSRKNREDFFFPLNSNRKYRSAIGCERYNSSFKFFMDDHYGGTSLNARGLGGAFAFAQQVGRFTFGVFRDNSSDNGDGLSSQVNDRIEFLDPDSPMVAVLKEKKEGYHVTAAINKRLTAGYLKSNEDIHASLDFADAQDDYFIPGNLMGEHREVSLGYRFSPRYTLKTYYEHSSFDNLDDITYNTTQSIGRWLSAAEYDSKNFYLTRSPSPNKSYMFGYEDYDAYYRMAGFIDVFGNSASFLTGYYLFHSNGLMHRNTYKYSMERKKGSYKYRFMYAYSTGDAGVHFDSMQRVFLTFKVKSDDSRDYNYSQHQLGLGIEKKIAADTYFRYALIQTVPILDRINVPPSPAAVAGAPAEEKKKSRGGTLHLFSVVFML